MDVVLTLSPNNEVRLGCQSLHSTPKKRTDATGTLAREVIDRIMSVSHIEVIEGYRSRVLTGLSTLERFQTISESDAEHWRKRQKLSLDFISKFQRVCKRHLKKGHSGVGYGKLGRGSVFSRFARSKMLAAGAILERKYTEPGHSVLVTLTIPGNHKSARDVIPRYSGWIMNRLMQIIRRAQEGRDEDEKTDWLYCWEYQRRSFLHLHLCIADPYPGVAEMLGHDIKDKWLELLQELSEMTGQCLFTHGSGKFCWMPHLWQNDVSVVRKSVACYLSKYVSKGANQSGSDANAPRHQPYPVARWWGMGRALSQAVERAKSEIAIRGLSEDAATAVVSQIADALKRIGVMSSYCYQFDIKGSKTHIGSGHRQVMYIDPAKFDMVAVTLGGYLRSLCSSVHKEQVKGKNWLLVPFGFDTVEPPCYYLDTVTTIKRDDISWIATDT